jgi:outer membrane protein
MKKLLVAAILASVAAPAFAQTLPPAVIVTVDAEEVITASAAWKAAQPELKAKADALQALVRQRQTSFQAEEQTLGQTRPTAAGPAATAWEAKLKDYQTRVQQAQADVQRREQELQATQQYVVAQINNGAQPIISAIMKERGANIALNERVTIQHASALDISTEVVSRLDKALPKVAVTLPPAPAPAAPPK